jgi:hypothetical protein
MSQFGIVGARDVRTSKQIIAVAGATGAQMAAALGSLLGEEVAYQYVLPEVYRTFGFPGTDGLGNMFQFKRDFAAEFCGARNVAFSRLLNPKLQTFAQWIDANKEKITAA